MTINESNLQFTGTPNTRSQTTTIILHHADAVSCSVEDIHRWHLERGWLGIGYQYFIRKDGSIWRGRPEDWVGAHAGNPANTFSIGICFEAHTRTRTPTCRRRSVRQAASWFRTS